MNKKTIITLASLAVVCFIVIYAGITITSRIGKTNQEVSEEQSISKLERVLNKITVTDVQPRKATVSLGSNPEDELPDINKYPLSVTGKGDLDIEIFATSEKAGNGNDGWLNEMAEAFNKKKKKIGDKTVSISVRPIASGLGMDYIISGKYLPDAFTPSNELWGKMIESKGVKIKLAKERLVGNVAGILLTKDKQDLLIEKYGSVNMKTITQATADNDIIMGYTNPFASATGLNFLISTLNSYDPADPFSDEAVAGFEAFQANVPFVAYTTLQMRDAADSGVLNGMILEYQTYTNTRELKDYTFTPFGVRHDNPVYAIGEQSKESKNALNLFLEYCSSDEAQTLATNYGFNNLNDYKSELTEYSGDILLDAQKLWKEKKDSGKPVTAVFVADVSGSMAGEPLNNLKRSLINGSQYINEDNYIGLVSYNSKVFVNLPVGKFDLNQRAYFTGAVEDLDAVGGTASFDAVTVALKMLLDAKEANPDTKLIMFLLSDGETNQGHTLQNIKDIITGLDIPIYTIGYNADIAALETISSLNEAASINADSEDVIYQLKNLFNSQM